jgi:hypothetical protein
MAARSKVSGPIISQSRMRFLAKLSSFCDLLLERFVFWKCIPRPKPASQIFQPRQMAQREVKLLSEEIDKKSTFCKDAWR